MLTRLRIQGFRNLLDVDLRLSPLTFLAGRTGSGKSGIFDAIRFLDLLARHPMEEAAARLQGGWSQGLSEPGHLFSCFGDWRARELRFTAEMIVTQQVEDDFGVSTEAATTALQYVVGLKLERSRGVERLALSEESLLPLGVHAYRRRLGFPSKPEFRKIITGRRAAPFVSTETDGPKGELEIRVHHEGHGGRRFPARRAARTALSGLADSEFPAILAVRREMESWRHLSPEPSALRRASDYRDPESLGPLGENLAAALARLERADADPGATLSALAAALRSIGEDVQDVRIVDDRARRTRSLELRGQDGLFRPTWALSDATLRVLAVAVGLTEARIGGLFCLEELENGLHPERLPSLAALLRRSAVDASRSVGPDNPLRQLLVSTHSPRLLRELTADEVVFVDPMEVERGGVVSRIGVLRAPAGSWREEQRNGVEQEDPIQSTISLVMPPPIERQGQFTLPFNDPSE